ncbi:MAG: efflux RND transporter permease subunit [Paludibacteraceae bacterium]
MAKRNHIEGAMRNHGLVFFFFAALTLFGVWALTKMNKDEFPFFTIRQGVVVAVYPGATAQEVEAQVTKPLEDYINGFEEVDKAHTYSVTEDGMVYVYVSLRMFVKSNNEAWSRIRANLDLFRKTSLPKGVVAMMVVDDFGNTSSMLLAVESRERTPRELEQFARQLSDRLRTIPEMGKIKILGQRQEEIAVTIDPARLSAYGVNQNLLNAQLLLQGLRTMTGSEDGAQYQVVIPYGSEHEIAEQIIWSDAASGAALRLKDVATVERRYASPAKYVDFYEGGTQERANCLIISMEMTPGNNIVEFGEKVEAQLKTARAELPPDLQFHRITDQPKVVDASVSSFLRDIIISILVVILVMLMLFPLRTALVASTGVPVCIAIALGLMYLMGIELNTVTLAALIFVLGMIVDDSVIVIDGYTNLLEKGHSRWYSAAVSTRQLFVPMALATCSISGMFFPMTKIITGPLGEFIQLFPFAITFALVSSIFYATWVTPYMATRFVRRTRPEEMSWFERRQNKFFGWLQRGYEKMLRRCFNRPWGVYLLLVGSIGLGLFLLTRLNIQLLPKAERECFAVEIHLREGSPLEETAEVCDSLARILQQDPRVKSVTSFVGQASPRFHAIYAPNMAKPSYGQFIVNTVSCNATLDVIREYTPKYENYFPNAYIRFKQVDYQAAKNPVEVRFKGGDLEQMAVLADSLKAFMAQQPEMTWVHSDYDQFVRQVRIVLKEDEATRLGITQTQLSLYLATLHSGTTVTTIYEDDYPVPVVLYMDKEPGMGSQEQGLAQLSTLNSQSSLEDLLIPTNIPSVWVPLRQVATLEPAWHRASITHYNGIPTITVGCDLRGKTSSVAAEKKVKQWIKTHLNDLPEGISISYGGLSAVNSEMVPQILWSVVAALLVMLVLLLYHFGKVSLAILTLSSALLCIYGAFLGLFIFRLDISMTAFLGLVALIGVIVRNAIMMYEYAEELRKTKHLSVRDAAYEAGLRRMRPIFLTSATTALGVMPMIIAHTSLWMPMGVVICFGTIFTLPLTITILPVMYWKLMGRSERKGGTVSGAQQEQLSDALPPQKETPTLQKSVVKPVLTILLCLLCCLPAIADTNLSTPSLRMEEQGGASTPSLCREGRGGSSLTLDSCLQLARKNNPELKKAVLEVEKAKQVKQQAFTNYFPQVSATAVGYHALHPIIDVGLTDLGNANTREILQVLYEEYGAALGLQNHLSLFQYGYTVGVSAVQPVYVGGKIAAGNRLAKVGIQAAELQREVQERDVLEEVEESYWLIVGLQEKQETVEAVSALLDTLHHTVQTAVNAGLTLPTDLLQVEIKQSEIRRTRLQLESGLRLAKRALAIAIGVEDITIIEDAGISPAVQECTVSGSHDNDTIDTNLSPYLERDGEAHLSPSLCREGWGGSSPEHDLLALQVEAAQLQKRMVLADALPQVAVGANYAYGKFQADILRDGFGSNTGNGMLFLTVKLPLTEWWETGHKLKQQNLALEQAKIDQAHLSEMLDLRTQQVYDQLQQSVLMVAEQEQVLQKAQQNYQLMQANYQAGMATLTDLLTAQTTLLKAQNDLTDAIIAYRVSARRYADLTRSNRTRLGAQESSSASDKEQGGGATSRKAQQLTSHQYASAIDHSERHTLNLQKYDIPFPFHSFW